MSALLGHNSVGILSPGFPSINNLDNFIEAVLYKLSRVKDVLRQFIISASFYKTFLPVFVWATDIKLTPVVSLKVTWHGLYQPTSREHVL